MLHWKLISFNELTNNQLYAVLKLRTDVFVVEQNCPYPELDNKDQVSLHFCGFDSSGNIDAYCRILPPGISYDQASIGRVVVTEKARALKYGRILMNLAIEISHNTFKSTDIKIGAQCYLESFYSSLGFQRSSDNYIEDGIPHLEMIKKHPLK